MAETGALLKAHVAFEKKRLLDRTIWQSDLLALFESLAQETPAHFIRRDELTAALQAIARQTESCRPHLQELGERLHIQLKNSHYQLSELFPDERVRQAQAQSAALFPLFKMLAKNLIESKIFAHITADILYAGLKQFTLEKNILINLPGAAALLKVGQNLAQQTGLEEKAEKNLRQFIAQNTESIIRGAETVILDNIKLEHMQNLALELHNRIKEKTIAELAQAILAPPGAAGSELLEGIVEHELFANLSVLIGDQIFNTLSRSTFSSLLEAGSINVHALIDEICDLLLPALYELDRLGALEQIITNRLSAFYNSEEASRLLD